MPAMEHIAGNFFLIGLMGAGKTTQAKRLAEHFGCPCADTDQALVKRTGVSIATIFELEGEAGFRQRETDILKELATQKPLLLATGGGIILSAENRRILRENGTVIYLHAHPNTLYRRLAHDKTRPLLQVADPRAKLHELYQQRDPLYRQTAHHIINLRDKDHCDHITRQLIALIQNH